MYGRCKFGSNHINNDFFIVLVVRHVKPNHFSNDVMRFGWLRNWFV